MSVHSAETAPTGAAETERPATGLEAILEAIDQAIENAGPETNVEELLVERAQVSRDIGNTAVLASYAA